MMNWMMGCRWNKDEDELCLWLFFLVMPANDTLALFCVMFLHLGLYGVDAEERLVKIGHVYTCDFS
jgi:hypothetical protein